MSKRSRCRQGHSNPLKEKDRRRVKGSDVNILGFVTAVYPDVAYVRVESTKGDIEAWLYVNKIKGI